jgi:hypothetical protein
MDEVERPRLLGNEIFVDARGLGERAEAILRDAGEDLVPGPKSGHAVPDRRHHARELAAEDDRQRVLVDGTELSLARFEVDGVQPRGLHVDPDLTAPRLRGRHVTKLHDVRAAILGKDERRASSDGPHGSTVVMSSARGTPRSGGGAAVAQSVDQ